MTQQEKEQRLQQAASAYKENHRYYAKTMEEMYIEIVTSDFAKEYWQSQQKQETPELEEIRKIFDVQFLGLGEYLRKQLFNFFAPYIKGTEWVSVKDRLPTKEDANENGKVLCCNHNHKEIVARDFKYLDEKFYRYWCKIPKAPKEVGGD